MAHCVYSNNKGSRGEPCSSRKSHSSMEVCNYLCDSIEWKEDHLETTQKRMLKEYKEGVGITRDSDAQRSLLLCWRIIAGVPGMLDADKSKCYMQFDSSFQVKRPPL